MNGALRRPLVAIWLALSLLAAACATPGDEVLTLADQPPLDCAVLVTGGAFLVSGRTPGGTFVTPPDAAAPPAAAGGGEGNARGARNARVEAIPIAAFVDALERARVFQRVSLDADAAHRAAVSDQAMGRGRDPHFGEFLARARADGNDYLLVVEELRDGPIDELGTNGRWPVTFATWILLGVGAFIPDRTFESRATLKVTLRELQMGSVLHDWVLDAVPVDLALVERTDFVGLLTSIVVPPFWVGDDDGAVRDAVRDTTLRRLLTSLARDLKSDAMRQRLRERVAAEIVLVPTPAGPRLEVYSFEGLSVARLRGDGVDAADSERFTATLLASVRNDSGRYRYEAALPPGATAGQVQVLVGTLRGAVASATFAPGRLP